MSHDDSHALRSYFLGLEMHGIKLGLSNIEQLLEAAGQPQRLFPAVHVAGTNGKGSVLAFLDAMLRAAGVHTGRFTSPHLMDVTERFLVDAKPIFSADLDVHIAFFRNAALAAGFSPTFFEMCTAIAFRHFAESRVEAGLIETGMGGRLDSTNVILPVATAITNIAFDHTAYLGNTLDKIAFEKAGILKPGVPVALTECQPGLCETILERAKAVDAPVMLLGRDFTYSVSGDPWKPSFSYDSGSLHLQDTPLALPGKHQGSNAAAATALACLLQPTFPNLNEAAIRHGLSSARWPCRNERVLEDPPVYMDVAHNAAGAAEVAQQYRNCVTVLSVSSDKDAAGIIRAISTASFTLILTAFTGGRSLPVERLSEAAAGHPHRIVPHLSDAIEEGLRLADAEHPLLITGSIYAAGEARRLLIERHGAAPLLF